MQSSPWAPSFETIRLMKMDLTNEARNIWWPKFWMLHAFRFWPVGVAWLLACQVCRICRIIFGKTFYMYCLPRKRPNCIYSSVTLWCSFGLMCFQKFGSQSQVTTFRLSAWGAKARCEDRGHCLFKLWRWWHCCPVGQTIQTRTGVQTQTRRYLWTNAALRVPNCLGKAETFAGRRASECPLAT